VCKIISFMALGGFVCQIIFYGISAHTTALVSVRLKLTLCLLASTTWGKNKKERKKKRETNSFHTTALVSVRLKLTLRRFASTTLGRKKERERLILFIPQP
jgi:hypothetical protein